MYIINRAILKSCSFSLFPGPGRRITGTAAARWRTVASQRGLWWRRRSPGRQPRPTRLNHTLLHSCVCTNLVMDQPHYHTGMYSNITLYRSFSITTDCLVGVSGLIPGSNRIFVCLTNICFGVLNGIN